MKRHGMGALVVATVVVLVAMLLFTSVEELREENGTAAGSEAVQIVWGEMAVKSKNPDMNTLGLIENAAIYSEDKETSVVTFYVTVSKGDKGTNTNHTFAEVYNAVRFKDNAHVANDVFARAMVQVGNENGPQNGKLGYAVTKPNATIRVRGNSSSLYPQKSLKLTLDDEAGLWRGQSNISLVKSQGESSRMRNKIYFDLLREIPEVPSLRTQFVHLYLKDETAGEKTFKDYGLFTQTEVPSIKYLKNHGFDSSGYLYKAVSFNFEPVNDYGELLNFDDPAFDLESFEQVLKCKGREDNTRLLELIGMINDRSVDINEIIGSYIDRENYITWLAYNILMDNTDTTMQNFYLYSPLNSPKWYFIPWDGDAVLMRGEQEFSGTLGERYSNEYGIANFWGVELHRRFLINTGNRRALEAKVDELHKIVNRDKINAMTQKYDAVVRPFLTAYPDALHLKYPLNERDLLLRGMGEEVEIAYAKFKDSLDDLMPFYLYPLRQDKNELQLTWSEAYDFSNEDIRYRVIVSDSPDLSSPALDISDLTLTEYYTDTSVLAPGIWYWRVMATTPGGKQALPVDKSLVLDKYYPGVGIFEVSE